ncbi:hypothetical protein NO2_1513 [Candidatus Termititenax persephonae]|uniref:Outer membrane protein beta-barrel domain-containing protein n=1 Tax=Candidatus Termititenax persephonae TaxID=2218525 RepID=A0A388TJ90_9BACT|nr:hypothetical protein NO2_1513 [Candidatus Termititenax persephonae]
MGEAFGAERERSEKITWRGSVFFWGQLVMGDDIKGSFDAYSLTLYGVDVLELDSTLSFGLEYPLWRINKQAELLGGVSYALPQHASRIDKDIKLRWFRAESRHKKLRSGEFFVQNTSLYFKPRWFFNEVSTKNVVPYVGGKLAYGLLTFGGPYAKKLAPEGAIGTGLSFGVVFYDTVDLEFGRDGFFANKASQIDNVFVMLGYRL